MREWTTRIPTFQPQAPSAQASQNQPMRNYQQVQQATSPVAPKYQPAKTQTVQTAPTQRPQPQVQPARSPLTTTFMPRSQILREKRNNPSKKQNQPSQQQLADARKQALGLLGNNDFRYDPVNPGQVRVDDNFKTNIPLKDIVRQGGSALDNTINQAMVQGGYTGLPPALSNVQNDGFIVKNGQFVPANQVNSAPQIIRNGEQVNLPGNYIEANGRIYTFQNGDWQEVQDLNSINYDDFGYNPVSPPPARFDFAGNPLGAGGEVLTSPDFDTSIRRGSNFELQPGMGFNPTVGIFGASGAPIENGSDYIGAEIDGNDVFFNQENNPLGGLDTNNFIGNDGNINLSSIVRGGDRTLDPIKKIAMSIQNLGFNPNDILSNPALLEILLRGQL